MSDNIAVLRGYTREVMAEYTGTFSGIVQNRFLLIKPDADLTSRFKVWDTDLQAFSTINGSEFTFQDI